MTPHDDTYYSEKFIASQIEKVQKDLHLWIELYIKKYPKLELPFISSALIIESHCLNISSDKEFSMEMMEGDIESLERLLELFKNDAEMGNKNEN